MFYKKIYSSTSVFTRTMSSVMMKLRSWPCILQTEEVQCSNAHGGRGEHNYELSLERHRLSM